jgi:hypothetical protein
MKKVSKQKHLDVLLLHSNVLGHSIQYFEGQFPVRHCHVGTGPGSHDGHFLWKTGLLDCIDDFLFGDQGRHSAKPEGSGGDWEKNIL